MECCGAERPTDWTRGKEFNMGVSSNPTLYDIPESCCKTGSDPKECATATRNLKVGSEPNKQVIYENGCYNLIMDKLSNSVCCIMIVGGVTLSVQVLGLLLGLILMCSMNKSHRFKG